MVPIRYLLLLIVLIRTSSTVNVLMIPLPAHSHCLEMLGIGKEMMKRGHQIFMLMPHNFKTNCLDGAPNVGVIKFQATDVFTNTNEYIHKKMPAVAFSGTDPMANLTFISRFSGLGTELCESVLTDKQALQKLKSLNIDLTMVDGLPQGDCLYYIPIYLKSKTVMVSSVVFPQFSGQPLQSNVYPFPITTYTSRMTFSQKVINTIVTIFISYVGEIIKIARPLDLNKLRETLPEDVLNSDPNLAARNSLLFVENSDPAMDFPSATYPNHIRVGGLTTRPSKPLSKDLEEFFSKAKNGVVVVSFGSMLRKAPQAFFDKIVRIFDKVGFPAVMACDKVSNSKNVKTFAWLPQNDVLGHPKTRLFVSHCGKNGYNEGFYHGVPIICSPFYGDQATNAQKVRFYGLGSSIDVVNDHEDEIVKVIKDTLNNKTITENMKKRSAMYRDNPFTPQERAVNAIEHVLKYGGDHLRPMSTQFSIAGQAMMDIWLTIFLLLVTVLFVFYQILKCCLRCCGRMCRSSEKKKKE